MPSSSSRVDKLQLAKEVELVEKILAFAEKPETLDKAADFSLELMKTQRTAIFDAVDINEYVCYRFDVQRHRDENDLVRAAGSEEGSKEFLSQTLSDLKKARALLKS